MDHFATLRELMERAIALGEEGRGAESPVAQRWCADAEAIVNRWRDAIVEGEALDEDAFAAWSEGIAKRVHGMPNLGRGMGKIGGPPDSQLVAQLLDNRLRGYGVRLAEALWRRHYRDDRCNCRVSLKVGVLPTGPFTEILTVTDGYDVGGLMQCDHCETRWFHFRDSDVPDPCDRWQLATDDLKPCGVLNELKSDPAKKP